MTYLAKAKNLGLIVKINRNIVSTNKTYLLTDKKAFKCYFSEMQF